MSIEFIYTPGMQRLKELPLPEGAHSLTGRQTRKRSDTGDSHHGTHNACPGFSGGPGRLLERLVTQQRPTRLGLGGKKKGQHIQRCGGVLGRLQVGQQYAEGAGEAGRLIGPGSLCRGIRVPTRDVGSSGKNISRGVSDRTKWVGVLEGLF